MKASLVTGMNRGLGGLITSLLLGLVACGSDSSFFSIRFSSGTITDSAHCSGGSGQFPLEQQNGLVIVVIVTDNTTIIHASSGKPARCPDLIEGVRANVRGTDDNGDIRADQVEILSS
jgi:hypothetical protein